MKYAWNSIKSWDRSLQDVTRLCLGAATGCFLVGGALLLAGNLVPLAPRGIAILVVGCFFFIHGLLELAKQTLASRFYGRRTAQRS